MRQVPLYRNSADASVADITRRFREALSPFTRVVGLTWVHSSTGVRLPIRALADVVAETNRGRGEAESY